MTWTATNTTASGAGPDALGTPFTINGGTVILKRSDTFGGGAGNPNIVNNGTLLRYDAPVGAQTISATISGSAPLEVSSGQLTLSSGASTFTGNITNSGGKLIAGGAENVGVSGPFGVGGTIILNGGALGWSAANAFDYSPRFGTTGSPVYSFDTGGQNVTLATGLGGTTLTKNGAGTLTLSGISSYTGLTRVLTNQGELLFQGTKTGTADITVDDGGALGITTTGTQVTPSTLTLGSLSILNFYSVSSTVTAPLAATTLASSGTININIKNSTFNTIGLSYPLLSWSSGSAPAVNLQSLSGADGNLTTNGNTIQLNITATPYVWTGAGSANWDTTAVGNWLQSGGPVIYTDGVLALFDDSVTGDTNVIVNAFVQPKSVTVNNNASIYTITSSGANNIGGSAPLTKTGSGPLALLGGANTYTGVTTIGGGTTTIGALANGGSASDIGAASSSATNLVFNGGTLLYTNSAVSVNRLFSIGTSGGTLNASGTGALGLTNTGPIGLSGSGPRSFSLTGTNTDNNTLASALVDSAGGATALTKSSTGKWILSGTNTHSGVTTIANGGLLQIGTGGTLGTIGNGNVVNNGVIDFNRAGILTVSGAISGGGSVTNSGSGTNILTGNNIYTGGTTINAGTLQVGNGGASGSLNSTTFITNNSLLIFNSSSSVNTYQGNGNIAGTGNVIVQGGGLIKAIGPNTYSGWTRIDANTTFFVSEGATGTLLSSAVTNNGILRIVAQDAHFTYAGPIVGTGRVQIGANNPNVGVMTFTGTNTYTGGTFIGDNTLVLGDGFTFGAGSIAGNVIFTNNFTTVDDNARTLVFNRPDDLTFAGNITAGFSPAQGNRGTVRQDGFGILTLTGNNTYANTIVTVGTVVAGTGGAAVSIGTGTIANSGVLVVNSAGNVTVDGVFSGAGAFYKLGTGKMTLTNNNTYTGLTTVSNGLLVINGTNNSQQIDVYAPGALGGRGTLNPAFGFTGVTLNAGTTLVPGASVGTLTVNGDLTIGGNINVELDKSLSPSNDLVVVSGILTNTGTGTINVVNLGPGLVVGDTFPLFNKPLTNGAAMTITPSATATWNNNLAVDGTISVATVIPQPTMVITNIGGGNVRITWSGSTYHLQAQTNTLAQGLRNTAWVNIPGTSPVTIPAPATNGAVFFRLNTP